MVLFSLFYRAGSFDRDVKERPQRNPNVKKGTEKETIDKETIPKKVILLILYWVLATSKISV